MSDFFTRILRHLSILRASHPFSALMATTISGILMLRLDHSFQLTAAVVLDMLVIQIFTGFVNDYLDFEDDKKYQPSKPTSRNLIDKSLLRNYIASIIIFVPLFTVFTIPFGGIVVIALGIFLSILYNIGLKDTPFSAIVFVAAFGCLAFLPFVLLDNFSLGQIPIVFVLTGIVIALVLHIANDLVDYDVDRKRGARTFIIWLGKKYAMVLVTVLSFVLIYLYYNSLPIIALVVISTLSIIYSFIRGSTKLSEYSYYLSVICYVLLLTFIPIL